MRVPYPELQNTLSQILLKLGFEPSRAALCARLFADASRDGVHSHGLNRFAQFIRMINTGIIDIHAHAEPVVAFGALERWDGRRGPGNLNAYTCMARAIELARVHGLGCVALANTNHWMRGGNYGWQAADAGVVGICWTNTLANLPPWGASDPRVGNNPVVIAVPRDSGHIVLDMAVSQFSYGTLASYRLRGEQLPADGGFDSDGRLTRDPAAIEASQRALPIGYWKGSGLALLLDMVATVLSGGCPTYQIPRDTERETNLSQVFLALDPCTLDGKAENGQTKAWEALADQIIDHFRFPPAAGGEQVRYPGERVLQIRAESMANGVTVDPTIWAAVQNLRH
jgi:3-dehydro-L-gulonate 2-dehydrogenase